MTRQVSSTKRISCGSDRVQVYGTENNGVLIHVSPLRSIAFNKNVVCLKNASI